MSTNNQSIPISQIVQVIPGVIDAGAGSVQMNGVLISQNPLVPNNQVMAFASAQAVGQYFGQDSTEYDLANRIYFQGYVNSPRKPGLLYIAPFAAAPTKAFLQSQFLNSLTLAQLQALSGEFSLEIDGDAVSTGEINFAAVTSFSQAATVIATALNTPDPLVTVTWNAVNSTFIIETISTGADAKLTYAVDATGSTLAQSLKLTQAENATLSQGVIASTPQTCLDNIVQNTTDWFAFTTTWEPVQADKLAFAAANSANEKYLYAYFDTDPNCLVNNSETCTNFLIQANNYQNALGISGDAEGLLAKTRDIAVGVISFCPSLNFDQVNGRTTLAFRRFNNTSVTTANPLSAQALLSNGYTFYGNYANNTYNIIYNGAVTGEFKWFDSLYCQIYYNKLFEITLFDLLQELNSIPYDAVGYSNISLSLNSDINDMLSFGAIRTGVRLSAEQIAETTQQAGQDISSQLFNAGYFLQILDPPAPDRELRKSPIINFWYTDGQSVQQIIMNSTAIL